MQRYDMLKRLGDGSYGFVTMARNRDSCDFVAIKTLKRNYSTWEECISLREIRSLRSISKHPNIVQIKELIREDDSKLHFVFEYMPDGNLFHLIKSCAENKTNLKRHPYEISLEKIQSIVLQVLKGLDHIHSFGFIHRDIKPENLLFNGNLIKIGDFGLARKPRSKSDSPTLTQYISTRWYRAPEILLRDPTYSSKIDIFALGCVIGEMIELKPLFPGSSEIDQIQRIFSVLGQPNHMWPKGMTLLDGIRINVYDNNVPVPTNEHGSYLATSFDCHANLKNILPNGNGQIISFLRKLLIMNPNDRPSAKELLKDPYFTFTHTLLDEKRLKRATDSYNDKSSEEILCSRSPPCFGFVAAKRNEMRQQGISHCKYYSNADNNYNSVPKSVSEQREPNVCHENFDGLGFENELVSRSSISRNPFDNL